MSTLDFGVLLPHLAGVRVEAVLPEGRLLRVRAATQRGEATCPGCGGVTRRVHSRYQRRIYDQAVGGRCTVIDLTMRRFFCDTSGCAKTTFAEQVTGLTARHARHSVAARQALTRIAVAVGGRPGQRLTGHLALPAGRMTLLRLIRAMPEPAVATPRVLGVDDFALRRGHVYATVLIDMDTHRPVDVLPYREAATLEAWLKTHPGVQIICRDRAGAYAEGARAGAPDAVQVADRFHLWRNLGEAVEKVVVACRADLRDPQPQPDPTSGTPATEPTPAPQAEPRLATRTRERYAAVQQLLADGVSRAEITRRLGLDWHTVRRYADAETVDELLANTRRDSLIDPFAPYLNQRFNDGCTDATALFDEIRAQGFRGSVKTVRRYLPAALPRHLRTQHLTRTAQAPPRSPLDHDRSGQPRPRRPDPSGRNPRA